MKAHVRDTFLGLLDEGHELTFHDVQVFLEELHGSARMKVERKAYLWEVTVTWTDINGTGEEKGTYANIDGAVEKVMRKILHSL